MWCALYVCAAFALEFLLVFIEGIWGGTAAAKEAGVKTFVNLADTEAEDMFFRLVAQLAEKDGITEMLKAENQMLWVQRMNAVRAMTTEIVNNDLIYT